MMCLKLTWNISIFQLILLLLMICDSIDVLVNALDNNNNNNINNNNNQIDCPKRCKCVGPNVTCPPVGLRTVPRLPSDTETIIIDFNRIVEIPDKAFANLSKLKMLILNSDNIYYLHANAFDGLTSLRFLHLRNNHISSLPKQIFQQSHALYEIHLDNNEIWQLEPGTFDNLPNLVFLSLSGNKITTLPAGIFNNLPGIFRLYLEKNPIACDCGVYSLWQHVHQTKLRQTVNVALICSTPNDLFNLSFTALQPQHFHCQHPVSFYAPNDVTANEGETIDLPCRMTGEPEPQIVWYRNNNEIMYDYSKNLQLLPNGSLRFNHVAASDVGIYECIGRNTVGITKAHPIHLSLHTQQQLLQQSQQEQQQQQQAKAEQYPDVAPQFTQRPTDKIVPLHDAIEMTLVLECAAIGNPQPEIQWYFNGRLVTHSTANVRVQTNGSLVIMQPSIQAAGVYRCEATNHLGSIDASATVDIRELPVIIKAPQNQTVKLGKSFILECDADGNPMPTISWQFNGIPIENNDQHLLLENENTELILSEARTEDSGDYICSAENEHGRTLATATIIVEKMHSAPRLIVEPFDIEAITGTTIELPCRPSDNEGIKIIWRHQGRTINPSSSLIANKYHITDNGNLYVSNVSLQDSGRYECQINNDYGRVAASALITIRKIVDLAPGDRFVRIAFVEAAREIDMAINNTVDMLFSNRSTKTANNAHTNFADLLRIVRFPKGEARQLARAAEIYERTLVNIRKHVLKGENLSIESEKYEFRDLLSREHLHLVAELSGCMEPREMPNCTDMCLHSKYRSIDGTCNNLMHPHWGVSLAAFRRIEKPIYENGFSMPIGWTKNKLYAGHPKPSARLVSTELISTKEITPDDTITHMVMQWGQFLDHDLDHAIPSVSSESWDGVDCKKTCEFAPPCFPVEVPPNDPRIKNRRCIDIIRSSSICGSGMTSVFFDSIQHREQINQHTSYIDASQVYGFTHAFAQDLRNLTTDDGLLRVGVHFPKQKNLLPFAAPQDGMDCRLNLDENTMKCFVSGDIRVNEQVGLLAMHTIWMREHNRIAIKFRDINPHWDGDTIYQETRKIVGAQMQHITYKHWLPLILGDSGMHMLGEYRGYDPNINPTIANEFATVALRFGHTIINPILHRLNSSYQTISEGHLKLHKAFFAPWRLAYEGGVDPLMRGMFAVPAKLKTPDQNLNTELTEKLFQSAHAVALDLASMNIQRGRDHGIPAYNVYRKFCNLSVAETFDDLQQDISSSAVRQKLEKLYGHPDNIDVWVGAVLEDQVSGAKVGPLLQCLLIEQFKRLRDGDRFYYENPSAFTPEQLQQIKQANLARVLCDNGDNIAEATDDVFILPQHQGGFKSCNKIAGINLYFWQDCGTCSNNQPALLSSYVPQTYPLHGTRRKRHDSDNMEPQPAFANSELLSLYNINEERLGGLEDIIGSVEKELHRLHKKLRRLEDNLAKPNVKPKHSHCIDAKGTTRINNEVWNPDPCSRCDCHHAQITCILEKCAELICTDNMSPIILPDKCCPQCMKKKIDSNNNNNNSSNSNINNDTINLI